MADDCQAKIRKFEGLERGEEMVLLNQKSTREKDAQDRPSEESDFGERIWAS
jgi:hypothetical protein